MLNGKLVLLVIVWCCIFETVCPTLILFNALKNTVSNTRCKLHKLGTKIVSHDHKFGDPCEASEKHVENGLDSHQLTEQSPATPYLATESNEPKGNQQSESGIEHQNQAVTTENYPGSLDIDVRMGSDDRTTSKYPSSTRKFATVPPGGGKRIFKAPCKDGQVETADGCMEEV